MIRHVRVDAGTSSYVNDISIGPHRLQADEPQDMGGSDAGPNPYELLLAALGACASITVRMYAHRRQWPLREVRIDLSYAKAHAEDCAKCDTEVRMIDRIDMQISFVGALSDDQRSRLMDVADKCPVHRTLTSQVQISARQV